MILEDTEQAHISKSSGTSCMSLNGGIKNEFQLLGINFFSFVLYLFEHYIEFVFPPGN